MTCRDVQERIDAIAGGDEPATDAFRAHVEGCLRCASALARARRIEATLAARPAPSAPARFTAAVAARIRREHWRSEQQVDRVFNVAVAVGLAAIAGGALALMNLTNVSGTIAAGLAALTTFASQPGGRGATQAVPALSTYLLAGGMLLTALFVWSWAERSGRSS